MNTYLNIRRLYSSNIGKSEIMSDLLFPFPQVTIKRSFSCGADQGTWKDSPFTEVSTIAPNIHPEVKEFCQQTVEKDLTFPYAMSLLYNAITDSIERSWDKNKFHVVFASSGYDSRIIAACIKRLIQNNGAEWLGKGILFLSNRWESTNFESIMHGQGWNKEQYFSYTQGEDGEHFRRALNVKTAWQTMNAPCPIPGNLWYYLIDIAKENGKIPSGVEMQGYCGYWANESWNSFTQAKNDWLYKISSQYGYTTMSALPCPIPLEYPMVDLEVIKILARIKNVSGDTLRKDLSVYVSPETQHIERIADSDCYHKLSPALVQDIDRIYNSMWYAKNVRGLILPNHSGYSDEWARFNLASICEHLLEQGIKIRVV